MTEEKNKDSTEKNKQNPYKYVPSANEFAAIYARKSTLLENNSIKSQIELAKKRIKEKNLFLFNIYSDEESATKYHPTHRPGFKKLLYDAKNEKFKTLVVFRRDRLARRVEDLIEIKNMFKELGITIFYSNEDEFQPNDSYISNFIENIIMSVDELEPAIIRERIISAKLEKRLRGEHSGKPPWSYIRIPRCDGSTLSNYEPKNDTIKFLIRDLFEEFSNIKSSADSAKLLNKFNEKIKPLNHTLNSTSFKTLLLNPLYPGLVKLDPSEKISDYIESGIRPLNFKIFFRPSVNITPCTTENNYYKAIENVYKFLIERDSIIDDEPSYIFKSLLHCKKCSKPIHLNNGYYQCINGCTFFPKDDLEDFLLSKILKDIVTSTNIKSFQKNRLDKIESKIQDILDELPTLKQQQQNEIYSLVNNYKKLPTDFSLMEKHIKEENDLWDNCSKERENALDFKLTVDELENITKDSNLLNLVFMFRKNPEYSNLLLKQIIKKISIHFNSEVNMYDKRTRSIEYYK